ARVGNREQRQFVSPSPAEKSTTAACRQRAVLLPFLLPNSVAQGKTRRHETNYGFEKARMNSALFEQGDTRRDGHGQLSTSARCADIAGLRGRYEVCLWPISDVISTTTASGRPKKRCRFHHLCVGGACASAGWQISHAFPQNDADPALAAGCTLARSRPLCKFG